jgi:type 2A phosphatase activator TIP41
MRDTRVYVEHDSKRVIRQYTAKEGKYDGLQEKLRGMRERRRRGFPQRQRSGASAAHD